MLPQFLPEASFVESPGAVPDPQVLVWRRAMRQLATGAAPARTRREGRDAQPPALASAQESLAKAVLIQLVRVKVSLSADHGRRISAQPVRSVLSPKYWPNSHAARPSTSGPPRSATATLLARPPKNQVERCSRVRLSLIRSVVPAGPESALVQEVLRQFEFALLAAHHGPKQVSPLRWSFSLHGFPVVAERASRCVVRALPRCSTRLRVRQPTMPLALPNRYQRREEKTRPPVGTHGVGNPSTEEPCTLIK